jgi:ferredoxin
MAEAADVYRKLQRHLDAMPVAFPPTRSGVEIRILKRLFTPEEAAIALSLSAVPESLERIHSRVAASGMAIEELEQALDRLAEKGAILGGRILAGRDGAKRYSKAMLAIGMYELQVDRLTKELQEDVSQYMKEAFAEALLGGKTRQLRTVPVDARFVPERNVGTYDDARQLIASSVGPFAVLNCICRQGKDLIGEPCRQTDIRRTCLALKRVARACIDSGVGQVLDREETFGLLERAEQLGMVVQPENTQDPSFICFCCGCCCGVLTSAKLFPRPAEYLHGNYYAEVDPGACTACETCSTRCPMEALTSASGVTRVDRARCIGCGLCVSTCPSGALQLEPKERQVTPPRDSQALYRRILVDRFGPLGAVTIVGKALLGRRI